MFSTFFSLKLGIASNFMAMNLHSSIMWEKKCVFFLFTGLGKEQRKEKNDWKSVLHTDKSKARETEILNLLEDINRILKDIGIGKGLCILILV